MKRDGLFDDIPIEDVIDFGELILWSMDRAFTEWFTEWLRNGKPES